MASDLINLLLPVEQATSESCGDKYPTASLTIPILNQTIAILTNIICKSEAVLRFRASLVSHLNTRLAKMCQNNVLFICTLLDPRFKESGFFKAEDSVRARELVESLIADNAIAQDRSNNKDNNNESNNKQDESVTAKEKPSYIDLLQQELNRRQAALNNNNCNNSNNNESSKSELDKYLSHPTISLKDDPFAYWRLNKELFPILCKLSCKFLIIPGTSASSERIFSLAGNIIAQKRTRLSSKHISMMIFLNKNASN
jgi:hypothetical protein